MKQMLIAILVICLTPCWGAGQPNILFIIADDQAWDAIGAIGGEVQTPHLDRLVNEGVSFNRAYNMGSWSGAVCVASRHMFVSGRSLWAAQKLQGSKKKKKKQAEAPATPTTVTTWSQHLSAAGYRTYFSGKWHVSAFKTNDIFDVVGTERPGMPNQTSAGYNRPKTPDDHSWLPWDPQHNGFWKGGTHWSEVLRDESIDFIDQAKADGKPFFMYIAFNAPHDPRQAPKEYVDRYPIDKVAVPANFLPEYPHNEAIGSGRKLRDEKLAPFPRTEHMVKVHRAEYFALVTHMDEQIGQILAALESSSKADNTYIFFTADHGLGVGHHGLLGKQNMYEHSIAAPLIVKGPGLEAGKRLTERVYIQDIVPSTLELANLDKPADIYFDSFMPLVRGEVSSGRDLIYSAYKNLQRCIIYEDWKLIHYPTAAMYRLFNLADDPLELNDQIENPEYASKVAELKELLTAEMKALGDPLVK